MIPEQLPGLRPETGEQRFGSGCVFSHDGAETSVEVLAIFDHDYEGWHALIQHWDYQGNGLLVEGVVANQWNYGIVYCCSEFDWEPRLVHDYGLDRPRLADVGGYIDLYFDLPERYRYLLW